MHSRKHVLTLIELDLLTFAISCVNEVTVPPWKIIFRGKLFGKREKLRERYI